LQQVRLAIGDDDFFRLLRTWAQTRRGGNVTTDEFIALAERISGQDLGALFDTWLFTDTKPVVSAAAAAARAFTSGASPGALARSVVIRQERMRPAR
jgi:aminopeptidase N